MITVGALRLSASRGSVVGDRVHDQPVDRPGPARRHQQQPEPLAPRPPSRCPPSTAAAAGSSNAYDSGVSLTTPITRPGLGAARARAGPGPCTRAPAARCRIRSRRSSESCPGRLNAFDTVIGETPRSSARVFIVTRLGIVFNVIDDGPERQPCSRDRPALHGAVRRGARRERAAGGAAADRARPRASRGRAAVGDHRLRDRLRRVPARCGADRRRVRAAAGVHGRARAVHGGLAGVRRWRPPRRRWSPRGSLQGLGAALLAPAALAMLPQGERPVAIWTATAAVGGARGCCSAASWRARSAGAGSS